MKNIHTNPVNATMQPSGGVPPPNCTAFAFNLGLTNGYGSTTTTNLACDVLAPISGDASRSFSVVSAMGDGAQLIMQQSGIFDIVYETGSLVPELTSFAVNSSIYVVDSVTTGLREQSNDASTQQNDSGLETAHSLCFAANMGDIVQFSLNILCLTDTPTVAYGAVIASARVRIYQLLSGPVPRYHAGSFG